MIAEHEIGRHHLREAGDRSGVLVRAGVDLRPSREDDRGLAMYRPHRAEQRLAKHTPVVTGRDADRCCGYRGRRRQRPVADASGDHRDADC